MRVVPIEYAEANQLAESVFDTNGQLLVRKGTYLTEALIVKIKANGIFSVYINDRFSQNILQPLISEHLKNATIMEMAQVFEGARQYRLSGGKNHVELEKQMGVLIETARDIMYEIDRRTASRINYVDIKSMTTYTYAHPISVAILSYLLAKN